MKIYYAAPLFTHASQDYNAKVVDLLRNSMKKAIDIYLPQENEALNDKSGFADSILIAEGDNNYLLEADLLIAHIDGQEIDAGVASEIGIAFANNIPILGLYTDIRQSGIHHNFLKIEALDEIAENQFDYKNLYTIGLIKKSNSKQTHSGIARSMQELDLFVQDKLFQYENYNVKLEDVSKLTLAKSYLLDVNKWVRDDIEGMIQTAIASGSDYSHFTSYDNMNYFIEECRNGVYKNNKITEIGKILPLLSE